MNKLFKLSCWDSNYHTDYNRKEIYYLAPNREIVVNAILKRFKVDLTYGPCTKHYYDEESTTYKLQEIKATNLSLEPVSHYSSEYY